MDIKFKATVREGGNAFVVTIPKNYVDNDLIKLGNEYEFSVKGPLENDDE